MCCGAEDPHAAGGVLDHRQHAQGRTGQGLGLEEICGEEGLGLGAEKTGSGGVLPVGRGRDAVGLEDAPDGGGGYFDAKRGEFAVHSPLAPRGIFPYQAQHQGADGADGAWPAWAFGSGGLGMAAPQELAVPAKHGVGGDDQVKLAKLHAGDTVQQCGEQRPVGPGQLRPAHLMSQYGELVAQC